MHVRDYVQLIRGLLHITNKIVFSDNSLTKICELLIINKTKGTLGTNFKRNYQLQGILHY